MLNPKEFKMKYDLNKKQNEVKFNERFSEENYEIIGRWYSEMENSVEKVEKFTKLTVPPELVIFADRYLSNCGFTVGIPNNYEIEGGLYIHWD
jgi:hypothetical protein